MNLLFCTRIIIKSLTHDFSTQTSEFSNYMSLKGCLNVNWQVVVEKKLMRERQSTRHDLGREKFVSEVSFELL